jgi:hypothetical protein
VLAAGGTVVALMAAGAPAGAHGSGAIELLDATPSGPLEVRIEVCVAYADRHQAGERSEVTVRAQGPDTADVPAEPMTAEGSTGLYRATVEFPDEGSWTVIVESTDPEAVLSVPVTVGADDRASPAVTSGGAALGAACEEEPEELPTWLIVVGGVVGATVLFGALLWLMRRS